MEDKKESTVVNKTRTARRNVEVSEDTSKKVVRKSAMKTNETLEIKDDKKVQNINKESEKKEEVKEVVVEKNNGFNYAEVIVIMIITLILGGVIGSFITYVTKKDKQVIKTIVNNKGSSSTSLPAEFDEFLQAYDNIVNNYYEEVDSKKLIEAGISGMLNYLGDDYSVYMDEQVSETFNEQVNGKYTGIGVEIVLTDGGVEINRVFADSPAEKGGLKKGDVFVSVDGEDVTNKNPSEISNLIRNSKAGKVTVVVKRGEEEKSFDLKLKEVNIESVTSKIIEKNGKKVGYIKLSIFAENTYEQFKKKLDALESKKISSLIIDVRDNSGGYLTSVTSIASLFMDKSKIIYQLDTKGIVEQIYSTTKEKRTYPIIIITNGNSASASEILAAALQESYGAKIVGEHSYGKGTVQAAYQLKSGAIVKYTIQKWLTPKGNWINEKGVTPDVEVKLDEKYYTNPSDETDSQLQKAIEEIVK